MADFVAKQKTKKKEYSNVKKNTNKIGRKTGKRTRTGRDVYKVREDHPRAGELVSELTVTVPLAAETTTGDEVWLNAPSLHDGYEYSEDEVREMYQEDVLDPEEISLHGSAEEGTEASKARSAGLLEKRPRIQPRRRISRLK